MNEENKQDTQQERFTYRYCAKQQAEVEAIRRKYIPKEEDAMERLRRLDKSVGKKGASAAIMLGTLSSLVFGTGMSMTMVWTDRLLLPGIAIGLLGMAGMAAAYPLYRHIVHRERERIAPQVLRLTQELLK